MNIHIRLRVEMLDRVVPFLKRPDLNLNPYQMNLATQIEAIHTELSKVASNQRAAHGVYRSSAERRRVHAQELRRMMRDLAEVAKTLSFEECPGAKDFFRMPRGNGHHRLLAHGQAFLKQAEKIKASFTARGFSEDFFTGMKDLLTAIEQARADRDRGKVRQLGATASL